MRKDKGMSRNKKNKPEEKGEVIQDQNVDLQEIVDRKKLQNAVLKKMIDSIHKDKNNNL